MDVIDTTGTCIIVGGGLAGLTTALSLAPRPVILLNKAPLGFESSSVLAQGGIAASLGSDDDFSLHLADSLKAGDGLCHESVASAVLKAAPLAISELIRCGVPFDRDAQNRLVL